MSIRSRRKFRIIGKLLPMIISSGNQETVKKAVDAFLDVIEDRIEETETKVDDAILLPLCQLARKLLGIPDDDD